MPRKKKKTYCQQCKSSRCGHLHSRRCPVYEGKALTHCTCAWKAAAAAEGLFSTTRTIRR